jgi:hypothetical protein
MIRLGKVSVTVKIFEVFAKMTGKDYFLNGSVALMG